MNNVNIDVTNAAGDSTSVIDVLFVKFSTEPASSATAVANESHRIIEYINGSINLSIILPIVVTGIVLLIVAVCLYCNSRKDQRRLRQLMVNNQGTGCIRPFVSPPKTFRRTNSARHSARSSKSSRSRDLNLYERISIAPAENDNKSLLSGHESRMVGSMSPKLSIIDEFKESKGKTSRGVCYDSGDIPMHSFNNTSWLTSQSVKDNRMKESFEYENPYFSAPGKLAGHKSNYGYSPGNSPFFPNNNTPTTDCDRTSDRDTYVPEADCTSLNNTRSFSNSDQTAHLPPPNPHPSLEAIELSSIATYPELSFPARQQFENMQQETIAQLSSQSSYTDSTSDSLSLPSSISRYHASRLYGNTPSQLYPLASTHNSSPMRFNLTLASSIEVSDHYSDNTSMLPCVGSSITSADVQATANSNTYESFSNEKLMYDNLGFESDQLQEKSSSAPATRRGSISKADVGTNASGKSSFGVNLFRSWSVTADLDVSSLSHLHSKLLTPLSLLKKSTLTLPSRQNNRLSFLGHVPSPVFNINQVAEPAQVRKVKFTVPVLDKKQYWV